MTFKVIQFVRRPLYVDAVQLTAENLFEVAEWCEGQIKDLTADKKQSNKTHILVDVPRALNQRQREAYVGDWVLKAGAGFKVYNDHAFQKCFVETDKKPRSPRVLSEKTGQKRPPKIPSQNDGHVSLSFPDREGDWRDEANGNAA